MSTINRRNFLKKSTLGTAGMTIGYPMIKKGYVRNNYNEIVNSSENITFNEEINTNQKVWEDISKIIPPHPYLFFKKEDLPGLRQKIKFSPFKDMWEMILTRCKKPDFKDIESLSLAYLVTGEKSFADRAKANIWEILDVPKWDEPQFLSVNPRLFSSAIVYDWLYDYLSEEERNKIRKVAIEKGIKVTYDAAQQHLWWTNWSRCNWGLVIFSAAGVASVTFLGKEKEIPYYLQFFSDKLKLWLMEGEVDGDWGESLSYYSYAWFNGLRFIDAMKNVSNGRIDFFKYPFMNKTFLYPLYLTFPDDSSFVNFSNLGGDISTTNHIMRRIASEYKNPYAQWHASKKVGTSPFEFIWYNPNLEPKPPVDFPKAKLFKTIHWAVMRTGWTDKNDILFAMKGGHNDWDHHHLDHNTFILNAYGERLIIDHGYAWATPPDRIPYANDTIAHNTLLVNGKGQLDGATNYAGGRGAWEHFTPLSDFINTEHYDGITGNAKCAYAEDLLREYIRQVMFIRPDYFFIFDNVEADEPSTFEWLFHTFGKMNVEDNCVMITQGNATLAIRVLEPEPFAYDFSTHSMEGSRNRFVRENTDNYIKLRPSEKCKQANLLCVLYPAKTIDEKRTKDFLTNIKKIDGNNCVGVNIQRGKACDIFIFDRNISERREPRTMSLDDISTDGWKCMLRKESSGEVTAFSIHHGKNLSAGNIPIISTLQTVSAALSNSIDKIKGCINLVATSTVNIYLYKKPKNVYMGNKIIDFSYDDKNRIVSFTLPFGEHEILIE